MRTHRLRAILLLIGCTCGAVAAARAQELPSDTPADTPDPSAPETAAETQAEDQATGLSETERRRVEQIVVTARRREELLEETPISVTALGEATLRETGVTRLDQIQDLVPNLSFYSGRAGLTSAVFIRGVGQPDPVITFDPGVGIYVDGVYLARQAGSILNVSDIEQVEVLRGPQGTLFGKNTVGGAINITTIQPREELEGFAMLRAGSFNQVQTRAMLNVPVKSGWLDGKLFTRFAFSSENNTGYTLNTLQDRPGNTTNSLAFLGAIRFTPTDRFTTTLKGSWFRDHGNSKGGECVPVQPPPLGSLVPPGFVEACERSNHPYMFEADTAAISDIETYGIWNVADYEVGDLGPLESLLVKSISAWREQIPKIREEGDGTAIRVLQLDDYGPQNDETFVGGPGFQQQISQEIQLQGNALDGDLSYIGGYFVYWETASFNQTIESPLLGPPTLGSTSNAKVNVDNWSWALFGQGTWDIFDWLGLTGGVRYTEEKKGFAKYQVNILELPPGANPILVDANESTIFTNWSPMGNLTLRAPDDWLDELYLDSLMGYFTYSEGFKGGGFNGSTRSGVPEQLVPYAPETLESYEIGFKTIGWEQKLTFNTSFFYGKYDDIQVSTIEPGTGFLAEIVIRNAAKATTKGAEFELNLLPFEGASVIGSIGLLDAKYDEFTSVSALNNSEIDRAGEPFNNSPKFQSRLTLLYSFALPEFGPAWLNGWLTPRLDWYYRSAVNFYFPELPQATQPAYNLLHARISYDFNDDRSQFAVWGQNLTDQEYFQQVLPTASTLGNILRYYEPPRALGIEISHRF